MNVLSWGPGDFPVSYSEIPRGTLEIVIQEILWSIQGSYSAKWSLHLTNVKWHSDPWPTVASQPIRLSTNFMTLIPSLTFTNLWVVSMEHLQRVWHASRVHLTSPTHGSVPLWGACICSDCWDQFSWLYTDLPSVPNMTFIKLREVSMEHLRRVWHASREHLPFLTPGSVPLFGTCLCSNCWDHISWTCITLWENYWW